MAIVNLEASPDFSIVRQMQLISTVLNEMEESIGPMWMLPENRLRVIVAEDGLIDFVIS